MSRAAIGMVAYLAAAAQPGRRRRLPCRPAASLRRLRAALRPAWGARRQRQCIAAGCPKLPRAASPAACARADDGGRRILAGTVNDIAALILAEPEAACGRQAPAARARIARADAGGHRHLGERHQQAAVGHVVHGGDAGPRRSARARIRRCALGGQIDRRRRALLAAADLAQIERLAEPAVGLADQQDRLAFGLEGERRRCS